MIWFDYMRLLSGVWLCEETKDENEEQLVEICQEVGPVVSFRLVIDRETTLSACHNSLGL